MFRKFLPLAMAFALASCSLAGGGSAPSDLDNACAMKRQKSAWFKHLNRVERKYAVPKATLLAMIHQESKFEARAKTPMRYRLGVIPVGRQSSAFGYSQALDGTWDWYQDETGRHGTRRYRFKDSVEFMGWYMTETRRRTGIEMNDTYRQYLAYHEGQSGYLKGTYKRKPWLMKVARKVSNRAVLYHSQLQSCGG